MTKPFLELLATSLPLAGQTGHKQNREKQKMSRKFILSDFKLDYTKIYYQILCSECKQKCTVVSSTPIVNQRNTQMALTK